MPIQSVRRSTAILRQFSVEEPELGVTELSDRLGLHKSTVHRLLTSLRRDGLVKRVPATRKYRLGISLIELGNTAVFNHAVLRIIHPYVHYVAQSVEESAILAVRDRDEVLCLLQARSPDMREAVTWAPRAPLDSTSSGRVFLADMAEKELNALLEKGLTPWTPMTITDPGELRALLAQVREDGFATAFEQYKEGHNSIAVPIRRPDGTDLAALTARGYSYRFTHQRVMKAMEIMRGVATDVSRKISSLPPDELELL